MSSFPNISFLYFFLWFYFGQHFKYNANLVTSFYGSWNKSKDFRRCHHFLSRLLCCTCWPRVLLLEDPTTHDEGRGKSSTKPRLLWILLGGSGKNVFFAAQDSWLQNFFPSSSAKEDQTNQMDRYPQDVLLSTNSTKAGGSVAPGNPSVITSSCYTQLSFLASFIAFSTNCDAVIGTS